MAGKLIYSIVFVALNAIILNFEYRETRKIGVAEIVGLSALILAALINFWAGSVPANTFKLLFFFSFSILIICELSKLTSSRLSATVNRISEEKGGVKFIRTYKNIRFVFVFVFLPVVLTIGQIILLWQNASR